MATAHVAMLCATIAPKTKKGAVAPTRSQRQGGRERWWAMSSPNSRHLAHSRRMDNAGRRAREKRSPGELN
jgi:hypothetical protein